MSLLLIALCACVAGALGAMPAFPLRNTAVAGTMYPAVGLGTGGYGLDVNRKYPECWIDEIPGCGDHAANATTTWLKLGGTRLDSANSYFNMPEIAKAMRASGVPREQIFLTSKVGPSNPLGYNDTLSQFAYIKQRMNIQYVDLLLIHWPTYAPSALSPVESTDPSCNHKSPQFDEKECRLSTWRAMLVIFNSGGAKAVGVSNFNITHLQEIIDAGLPLPAVNQCPFHLHRSSAQLALRQFCANHSILFNGYSPLGIPDLTVDVPQTSSLLLHKFPPPMAANVLDEPVVKAIAAAHNRSPAQVLLNWQYTLGIPTNPRCKDPAHMLENMNIFDFSLTAREIDQLGSFPQDYCDLPDDWYECVPRGAARPAQTSGVFYETAALRAAKRAAKRV